MHPETPFRVPPESGDSVRTDGHRDAPEAGPTTASRWAALRFLAAVLRAGAVVEVGSGSPAGPLALFEGMAPDGVLTSIAVDPEAQRAVRSALREAGVADNRARLITGLPEKVLPRLAEGSYDLVLVEAARREYPAYLEQGVRLLRPGGVQVFCGVPPDAEHGDPARRDPDATAVRDLTRAVRTDSGLVPLALPVGEGLLAVARLSGG